MLHRAGSILRRMTMDIDDYLQRMKREYRHLGLAGERCTRCGGAIETLLDSKGKNPMRCCWRCEGRGGGTRG